MKPAIIMALSLIALSACATTYQRQSFTGGFSETQLSENIFNVTFKGNGYTSRERTSDFTLLRSAEVALENGYNYFVIIDAQNYTKNSTYTTPSTSNTTGSANTSGTINSYGNYGTFNSNTSARSTTVTRGGQTYLISKPRASNTIVCFKEKPEGNPIIFDAVFLRNSIMKKYNLSGSDKNLNSSP